MKLSQYFDNRRAVGPVKINCLIKQVPEHFVWVFLNLPLVSHAFLCHGFILFRGLKNNDLGWRPRLTHYADYRELCWRHSSSAGQGLLQKFSLEQTSAQIWQTDLVHLCTWKRVKSLSKSVCLSKQVPWNFIWMNLAPFLGSKQYQDWDKKANKPWPYGCSIC